jgi:SprT protein
VSPTLEAEVRAKIEETLATARARYPNATFTTPTLVFRQMGRRAGLCSTNRATKNCTISINPDFFANHHEQMINRTVPHEVAHYVSLVVYGQQGDQGHGYLWQSVMRVLGIADANRCHTYSLEGVKTRQVSKPYAYKCGCMVHKETAYIHNKIQRGYTYTCRKCRQKLVYYCINQPYSFQVNPPAPVQAPTPVSPSEVKAVVVPTMTTEPKYKVITRMVNGILVNDRILIS